MRAFAAFATATATALATPALANDTMAELKTGGLVFVRSDVVQIESEDLYISPDAVRVAYSFRNGSDENVSSIVAFPMPEITADPYSNIALPEPGRDNFLSFTVTVEGRAIEPELEQRALAAGLDITDELSAAGIPVNHLAEGVREALTQLPADTLADWTARGIVTPDSYDDGSGWKTEYAPRWTLKSTYWWRMDFPAGRSIAVRHDYKPSVGGTTGLNFFYDGKPGGPYYENYKRKYCIDASLERALIKAAAQNENGYPPYWENWISYVLKTGANWASTIGRFHLTIDKGDTANLVSFCGDGVKKTGPTTFEMSYQDFYPENDIEILLLRKFEN